MAIDWQLPSSWGAVKLGLLAQEDSSQVRPADHPTDVFNYWGLDAIDKGQFAEPQPNLVSGSEIASTCVRFDSRHILYSKLRPYLNKVITPSIEGVGTTEWIVFRPNPGIVDRHYLAYVLRSEPFVTYATANSTGARMPRVRKDAFWEAPIPIPYPDDPARSLETQRRIVARIQALFAELQEARRLHAEIRADTEHLIVAALRTQFEELGSNSPPARLGDRTIAEILPGQHVMSTDYSSAPPGTPYITGPADFGTKFPVVSKWTAKPTVMSKPGDVLFTVKGSGVGKVNVAPPDEPICIGRQVMAIRPNGDRLLTDYLFFALLGRFDEFQALRQGAAIPGIRKEHVEGIEMPLPPRELQLQVIAFLEAVQGEVSEMQRAQADEAKMLDEIEQALLRQAFRGEL